MHWIIKPFAQCLFVHSVLPIRRNLRRVPLYKSVDLCNFGHAPRVGFRRLVSGLYSRSNAQSTAATMKAIRLS